jgi:hypothetical protein
VALPIGQVNRKMGREERINVQRSHFAQRVNIRAKVAVVDILKKDMAAMENEITAEEIAGSCVVDEER